MKTDVSGSERVDPLGHLPCGKVLDFRKGQTIYEADAAPEMLYLVLTGHVKVLWMQPGRKPVLADIYRADQFFGHASMLRGSACPEAAFAIGNSQVMAWSILEIESFVFRRPMLGIALIQSLVERNQEFAERIGNLSADSKARRVAHSLLHFSDRLGHETEDGSVEIMPLSHQLLAQYVGTSKGIVMKHMIGFRRKGYVRYSRRDILVDYAGLATWLREAPVES